MERGIEITFSRTCAGREKMLAKTKFPVFRYLIADIERNVGERVDNWTKFCEFCPQVFFTVLWVYMKIS